MINVYLADDHSILREGLKFLLQGEPELFVTGESDTGQDTIREVTNGDFDLLVLDVHFPDTDEFDVLLKIKKNKPDLSVLILTLNNDESMASRFLKAGASGYVVKDTSPIQIIEAMRCVARGERFLDPGMAITTENFNHMESQHECLTDREYLIFLKFAHGHSTQSIANELNIAPSTVSNHRMHIMQKMRFANNSELVRYAISNKLLF